MPFVAIFRVRKDPSVQSGLLDPLELPAPLVPLAQQVLSAPRDLPAPLEVLVMQEQMEMMDKQVISYLLQLDHE